MQNITRALVKTSLKGFTQILKVSVACKCITDSELRIFTGSVLKGNVEFKNIMVFNQDGTQRKIKGSFNRESDEIALDIKGSTYKKTLLHETVHLWQWTKAKKIAEKRGVEPCMQLGVVYNKEFDKAKANARAIVASHPEWSAEYVEYYMRDWEIEARYIASKLS